MMPIKDPNNDQNIERGGTKMSEGCPNQNNNAELIDRSETPNCLNNVNNSDNKDDSNLPYDHMYATNTDVTDLNVSDENWQDTESEVKFLKEWLLLHLDLIQQQNEEILSKERTILILQQENEMLRERIGCLDRTFQPNTLNNYTSQEYSCEDQLDNMTQDASHIDDDNKSGLYFLEPHNSDVKNCISVTNFDHNHGDSVHDIDNNLGNCNSPHHTSNNCDKDLEVKIKKDSSITNVTDQDRTETDRSKLSPISESTNNSILKLNNSSFVVNSSMEDTLKNLRMSIRRKRVCSTSSALSNNDNSLDEPRSSRKKKKRKGAVSPVIESKSKLFECVPSIVGSVKDEKILTSHVQYVTQTGELGLGIFSDVDSNVDVPCANNLEVPRWRVKVYTSCYTMEGTENLDDEVYNKRHMRLESDERRRKRWDVQRIREQRVVEKLKRRQERIGSSSRVDVRSESVTSLWPSLEDVKYLEVCDHLPVSAFGAPVPRFSPSEFSLPWLNNPNALSIKKAPNRKSTIKRKATKR